jgi:hypothetical protein
MVGAVIVTGVIAAGAGALGTAIGDDDSTTSTTELSSLSAEAQELVDLLDMRDDTIYHARYQGSSPDAGGILLETWQSPPLARQDSELTAEGQTVRTATLVLESTEVRCTRIGDAAWTCAEGPLTDPDASDPLRDIRARLGEGSVTASDAQIDGQAVRCFRFAIEGVTNELCLRTDTGIPVTVNSGGSTLELLDLEEEVDQSVFVPPAE